MAQANVILNRLCDLQGTNFQIKDVHVSEEKIVWWIDHKENREYECPRCHNKTDACHARKWVKIKDVPLGRKDCIWMVNRAQILCSCSLNPIVEFMPFRSKYHRLTQRFVDYLEALLCLHQFTVADVARMFNVDYGIIYKIDHVVLLRLIQELEIPDPINISVDEKSFQKGHKYVTIVTDTDIGKVIWVSEDNRKKSLDQFFQILGPERCSRIQTVSKDLHRPYALSCKEFVPHALEVADPFHVVKRLGQALEECRKELMVESDISVKRKKKTGAVSLGSPVQTREYGSQTHRKSIETRATQQTTVPGLSSQRVIFYIV